MATGAEGEADPDWGIEAESELIVLHQQLEHEREGRRIEQLLALVARSIIDADADGVFAVSDEGQTLACNGRIVELFGIDGELVQVGGRSDVVMRACLKHVADAEGVVAYIQQGLLKPFEPFDVEIPMLDGRLLLAHSAPILFGEELLGRVWYVRDDTARYRRDEVQKSLLAHFQAQQERQAFLLHASELVNAAEDYEEVLDLLAAAAVPTLGDLCLVDVLTWDDNVVRMAARHADPGKQPMSDLLRANYAPSAQGPHPSIDVIRSGRIRWASAMDDDFLRATTHDDEHFLLVKALGFTSYMSVPIFAEARILGAITLVSAGSGRRFSEKDITLAQEFSARVAQVVANVHRNDAARLAAHTLQASLLPAKLPDVNGLSICAQYLPATVDHDVGGDFYDVLPTAGGGALLMIGDVAGHDIAAAAVMGKIRSAARALAGQTDDPLRLLEMVLEGWPNLEADRMATVLVAGLDRAGHLTVVSAGHPPPLLVTAGDAGFIDLEPSSPLGAPSTDLRPWQGKLAPGTTMLLFTDGLIEDRLRGFADGATKLRLVAQGHTDPTDLCERILEAFVLHEERHDDIAVMAVRRDDLR